MPNGRRIFLQHAAAATGYLAVGGFGLVGCGGGMKAPFGPASAGVSPATSRGKHADVLVDVASISRPYSGGELLPGNSVWSGATSPPPPPEVLGHMGESWRRQPSSLCTPVITHHVPEVPEHPRYLQLDEGGNNALIGSSIGAFLVRRPWAEWLLTRDTCHLLVVANTCDRFTCGHWTGHRCDIFVSRQEFRMPGGNDIALYATIDSPDYTKQALERHAGHLPEFTNCPPVIPCPEKT